MKTGQATIRKRVEFMAYQRSKAFCEKCNNYPELEVCEQCHKPVATRELPGRGSGPVWWVIRELLTEADFDAQATFNELLDGGKEMFIFGRIGVTPSIMLRGAFPKLYEKLFMEFKKVMIQRGRIISIASRLYWKDDILDWLNKNDSIDFMIENDLL